MGASTSRDRWRTCPREHCRGKGVLLATLGMVKRAHAFGDESAVRTFEAMLAHHLDTRGCGALAYCFMPDHLHVVVRGLREQSDAWLALVDFKRDTGAWLYARKLPARWQKGFDIRLLDRSEAVEAACLYVWNNPVRAGLVQHWDDYPFSGTIVDGTVQRRA